MMSKNWIEVTGIDPDKLYKLYEVIDDIGLHHEWSADDGELNVRIEGRYWVTFSADRDIMADIANDRNAYADAQRVAEMYWRE